MLERHIQDKTQKSYLWSHGRCLDLMGLGVGSGDLPGARPPPPPSAGSRSLRPSAHVHMGSPLP